MFDSSLKFKYDSQGFLVVEDVFEQTDLVQMRELIDRIVQNPDSAPDGVQISREGDTVADKNSDAAQHTDIRGIAFMARFDPRFQSFARNPKLLELVRGLIGPRVKVFRDQMLLKPPGGQAKPLHQDQSYFRVQPENDLVTAWIALDDATPENGCMCYVPGSHRYGIFEITSDPDRPVHHVPDTSQVTLEEPVSCPVPAGSVIFHHGCVLHNSEINRTETWRKAVIFHFSTSDAKSENEPLNNQISLEID